MGITVAFVDASMAVLSAERFRQKSIKKTINPSKTIINTADTDPAMIIDITTGCSVITVPTYAVPEGT